MTIDTNGSRLTPQIVSFTNSKMLEAMLRADFVALHPLQMLAVMNLVQVIDEKELKSEDVPKMVKKHFPQTFIGVRIVEDEHMVKDEIHFRDKNNQVLAKIVHLAVPGEH